MAVVGRYAAAQEDSAEHGDGTTSVQTASPSEPSGARCYTRRFRARHGTGESSTPQPCHWCEVYRAGSSPSKRPSPIFRRRLAARCDVSFDASFGGRINVVAMPSRACTCHCPGTPPPSILGRRVTRYCSSTLLCLFRSIPSEAYPFRLALVPIPPESTQRGTEWRSQVELVVERAWCGVA